MLGTQPPCTGGIGPSLEKQCSSSRAKLDEILLGLGPALHSITAFTLKVQHNHEVFVSRCMQEPLTILSGKRAPCCPPSFSKLTHAVCCTLAEALPALQELCLQGCCRDAAFSAFGSSCQNLTHVQVEAVAVPASTLHSMATSLPSLKCFTLTSASVKEVDNELTLYVDACLQALHTSKSMTKLVLDFDNKVLLARPGAHGVVPPNLVEFVCHCQIDNVTLAPELLRRLHTLVLIPNDASLVDGNIFNILKASPHLQMLSIKGLPKLIINCDGEATESDIPYLQARLLAGLQLVTPSLRLYGSKQNVAKILALLPILSRVQNCTIEYIATQGPCLDDVARVFPNLSLLHLRCDSLLTSSKGVGTELLDTLAACTFFRQFRARLHLHRKTSQLVNLYVSMPCLKVSGYMQSYSVYRSTVTESLLGQTLEVEEYRNVEGDHKY